MAVLKWVGAIILAALLVGAIMIGGAVLAFLASIATVVICIFMLAVAIRHW